MMPPWIPVLTAILFGPVVAILTSKFLDRMREKKQRRVELYLTAMSWRGWWLHPDSVRALNSIDTIFEKKSDKRVRDGWAAVIRHASTLRPDAQAHPDETRAWDARLLDLRVDLYQVLGAAVGYDHTIDYIKNQSYVPQYYVDAELEQILIRKQFVKVLTDDGIKVVVRNG